MIAMAALDRLRPVGLDELNEQAGLMTRVDRKYFVPLDVYERLLEASAADHRVLEIDGRRCFRYRSVYFDSPDFGFFRQHVQRRRHRFKVRTRTYCDSGGCHLEVKSKGYRGQTVKERIPHEPADAARLDEPALDFVAGIVGPDAERLRPVLETVYHRVTLTRGDQRVTCDFDLECLAGGRRHVGPADVLVETKSPGGTGAWDLWLRQEGIRPHSVSKYCVAASLLYPGLPSNPWRRTMRRYFEEGTPAVEEASCA